MRRAPIVITATAAGLAAVLGFQPHSRALPAAGAQAPTATAPGPASNGSARQLTGAVRLPSGDGRSQEISSFAGPQLAQQALAAQSANIDGVSGATYTSESYRASLQSAIDQLPAGTTAPAGQ